MWERSESWHKIRGWVRASKLCQNDLNGLTGLPNCMIAKANLRHAPKEEAGRTYSGYAVFVSNAKGKLRRK